MADGDTLHLLVIARGNADVLGTVRDVYNETFEADYGRRLDEGELEGLVDGDIGGDGGRHTAWRLALRFGNMEEEGAETDLAFVRHVADASVDLASQTESNILAVIKLRDPAQLSEHKALYEEVYALEMALREVVSYIFAARYPENLTDGLRKTGVKPGSSASLPKEAQLMKGGENQFFYILFGGYAVLNEAPEVKVRDITYAILTGTTIDEMRKLLDLRPIDDERHAGFLAGLQKLMDPVERLRNGVAHNRRVGKTVRANFHTAAEQLWEAIDAFWVGEGAARGLG